MPNLLTLGAEGSAGLPNLLNLLFSELGKLIKHKFPSLPSLLFLELAPIKHKKMPKISRNFFQGNMELENISDVFISSWGYTFGTDEKY